MTPRILNPECHHFTDRSDTFISIEEQDDLKKETCKSYGTDAWILGEPKPKYRCFCILINTLQCSICIWEAEEQYSHKIIKQLSYFKLG